MEEKKSPNTSIPESDAPGKKFVTSTEKKFVVSTDKKFVKDTSVTTATGKEKAAEAPGDDKNTTRANISSNHSQETATNPRTFKERVRANKKSRWIRFGIVSLIFFLWVIWMQRAWLLIFYPLLFDIYITGYIPFTWWKRSKSKTVRTVMSWVDAIVYALILVYFIFAFVGQNYMIPTSSLEKTLLTGDYLWVNKMVYGPRVPMTPIHFPLVHNTLPIINTKSYLDQPANEYHRLKGFRDVETFDIVVFNYPAGDTIATKAENSSNPMIGGRSYEQLVRMYGWDKVNNDKEMFGEIIYRPVDRRENYVKRAVGLPGQRLKIVNDTIYINGEPQAYPESVQFNFIFALNTPLTDDLAKELGISPGDYTLINSPQSRAGYIEYLDIPENSFIYGAPLTQAMLKQLKEKGKLINYVKYNDLPGESYTKGEMFPYGYGDSWTISDWGGSNGVLIPARGTKIRIDKNAWDLYQRCIRNYENNPTAKFVNGKMYIDGKPVETYTFKYNYYFMMGDNRDNSLDSRFWGFVPEDHIVGTPVFVIASIDQERGGIRTDRLFIDANPDK